MEKMWDFFVPLHSNMKQIEVVAAIIHDDEGRIFATQRGYGDYLTMHCFWCHVESGSLTLKEHEAARWLTKDQLDTVDWLPADLKVVEMLKM